MRKYLAALLSVAIVILTALAAVEVYTVDAIAQIAILALGTITTYFVPLLNGRWAGILKTGAALLAALIAAAAPLVIAGTYSPQAVLVVVLAGLNVLAVEVGVNVRKHAHMSAP